MKKMKAIVLFVALFGGMSVFAQVPQQLQKQPSKTEVNDAELQKFVDVQTKIMKESEGVQQKMLKAIEDEGLTVERYKEIRMAEMSQKELQLTEKEKLGKKHIDKKMQDVQQELQEKQSKIIEGSELSIDRYKEIALAIQTNPQLQQKFRKLMMEKMQQ